MSISDILAFCDRFGWVGIFALVLIFVLYFLILYTQKATNKSITSDFSNLSTTLASQNDRLVNTIITTNNNTQEKLLDIVNVQLTRALDNKTAVDREAHSESLRRRLDVSGEINDILGDVMNRYHSQRVSLIEFHNSRENFNGLSFAWYDVQYERVDRGIEPISTKAKNLQASNLIPIIKYINSSDNAIYVLDGDGIEELFDTVPVLHHQLREVGARKIIFVGIYATNGTDLIGLLCIEYNTGAPESSDWYDEYDLVNISGHLEQLLINA